MSPKINTAVVAAFLTLVAAPQLASAQALSSHRAVRHHTAPATVYVPSDARGSVAPYGVFRAPESPVYAPDAPTPRSYHNLGTPDFQDGSRG